MAKSKNHDFSPNFRNMEAEPGFFTPKVKLALTKLQQALVEALILYYFDPKCYIRFEIDIFGYKISRILS